MSKDPSADNAPPAYVSAPIDTSGVPPPSQQYQQYNQQQYQQPNMYGQPVIIAPIRLGSHPQACICSNCHGSVVTRVVYKSGLGTWAIAGGLCLFGFWLGCQFIPFCIDACKDAHHYCPNCNTFLGAKNLIS